MWVRILHVEDPLAWQTPRLVEVAVGTPLTKHIALFAERGLIKEV